MSRRVLLAPFEVAGIAGALRDALREQGDHAELWTIEPYPFGRGEDRLITGYAARARAGFAAPGAFDVLHFHFATTLLEYVDALWGKVRGRPLMLMHYHGDDCRLRLATGMRPIGAPPEWEAEQRDRERVIRRRLRLAGRLCRAAIVADLELAAHVTPWFDTVYVVPAPLALPLPVGTEPLDPRPGHGPIVLHAPTNRLVKGSATIEAAMVAVGARTPVRPALVSGLPRTQLLAEIARADVVVDQLNSVTTGIFALEAMALGKPVLVSYDPAQLSPAIRAQTPAVCVTPESLAGELEALARDPARRAALGAAGRAFVERTHAAHVVAERMSTIYDDAPTRGPGLFEVTAEGVGPIASSPG